MRAIRTPIVAVLAILGLGLGLSIDSMAADEAMPQAGQQAPAFSLPSENGSSISLASYRGKWVVLYFYPKDMTKGCTIEAHNFQQDMGKFDRLNAVVLGVSVDSVSSHQEFCAKDGLHFKLLSDQDKEVVKKYGTLSDNGMMSKRDTFLINPEGKIVKVWTGVDPNVSSQEVLEALNGFEKRG